MSSTELSRTERIQNALNNIGSWLLDVSTVEPGWDELILDIKPLADQIFVRVREIREGEEYIGTAGPLNATSKVLPDIQQLQRAAYHGSRGTWFTASVVVAANNWPEPQFSVGASYNREEEPESWKNEGSYSAPDIRAHLKSFPRAAEYVPAWAKERMEHRRRLAHLDEPDLEAPNPYLTAALAAFAKDTREQTLINVVRTMLGGDVLVDASGSLIIPEGHLDIGPHSRMVYQVIRVDEDNQALCVFSSPKYVGKGYSRDEKHEELILREPAMKVFMEFLEKPELSMIVIDPGTEHECYIERAQVQWVVTSPRNDGAKMALAAGDMQRLLGSLVSPASMLLLGVDPADETGSNFVFAPDEKGNPKSLLVFTSAIEIAAVDPHLEVRSAHALEVLRYAKSIGVDSVQVNMFNPSTVLSIRQIEELLDIMQEQGIAYGGGI